MLNCVAHRDFVGPVRRIETRVNSFVNCQTLNINCSAVNHVRFVTRQQQNKSIRPICKSNKICERCFTNVHTVAQNLYEEARLHQFEKKLGSS